MGPLVILNGVVSGETGVCEEGLGELDQDSLGRSCLYRSVDVLPKARTGQDDGD